MVINNSEEKVRHQFGNVKFSVLEVKVFQQEQKKGKVVKIDKVQTKCLNENAALKTDCSKLRV